MLRLLFCSFLFLFGSTIANAQTAPIPKIQPDRRDFTVGTSIVPRGLTQIESGVGGMLEGGSRRFSYGDVLVRVPVSRHFEARFGVPTYLVTRAAQSTYTSGGDNLLVEFRLASAKTGNWTFAATGNTTLPTGARSVVDRAYQPSLTLASNCALSSRATLLLNVGGASLRSDGERFDQFVAATSVRYALSDKWDTFTEFYGVSRMEKAGRTQKFSAGGFVYYPTRSVALDARFIGGIGNGQGGPDYGYSAGASFRF